MKSATSFRLDREAEAALTFLKRRGMRRSDAVRRGLVELADRQRRQELAREAQEVAVDAEDRAEKKRITALMDELAATRRPSDTR